MNLVTFLDYSGVAVFAATGALSASRKQMDIIGFLFLAGVTGIGGGTFRDLILDVPVFWIANHDYVLVCAAMAVLVFFTAHRVESRYKLLLWLDAVGLAAFAVMGAAKGLAVTGSPVIAIIMGVLTATFGGILRDILAGEPSVLLRPEVYVTAGLARGSIRWAIWLPCRPSPASSGASLPHWRSGEGRSASAGVFHPTRAGPGAGPRIFPDRSRPVQAA
jgi:uncharacterized membrane protein YeiH